MKTAAAELQEAPVRSAPCFELDVRSETGPLRQVLVHTPGEEMSLVSPENRLELLFDDILFEGRARQEHLSMCALFRKVVGAPGSVLEVGALLLESFAAEDARAEFVEGLSRVAPERNFQAFEADLKRLSPEELYRFALTGQSPLSLNALPLPNLIFTRDLCAVVGRHVILSHAATTARARESLIIRVILRHHPGFAHCRDHLISLPDSVTFEGGDLLVASPEVVLVGHSERTSYAGVMAAARALFEHTPVEHVLMVDLPKARYCMHLDTVFTFASEHECLVFPPIIERELYNVVHFTRGDEQRLSAEVWPSLHNALETLLERPLRFIPCGGADELNQKREQWTDGANVFALSPGVVLGYERNRHTFRALADHGYRTVTIEGLLSYYEESEYRISEKLAIKLEGNELSRGRGGPRCMTLPLARQG